MAESQGGPTRKDTYRVTVEITGVSDNAKEPWDKLTGGELDSDEFKYFPGGMAPAVSLGGKRTPGNIVVSRLYRLRRDHLKLNQMFDQVGKGKVTVTKTPLDIDGNVFNEGKPLVYKGTLKRVSPPEHDSESSDPGLLEIEITPDGDPVA